MGTGHPRQEHHQQVALGGPGRVRKKWQRWTETGEGGARWGPGRLRPATSEGWCWRDLPHPERVWMDMTPQPGKCQHQQVLERTFDCRVIELVPRRSIENPATIPRKRCPKFGMPIEVRSWFSMIVLTFQIGEAMLSVPTNPRDPMRSPNALRIFPMEKTEALGNVINALSSAGTARPLPCA